MFVVSPPGEVLEHKVDVSIALSSVGQCFSRLRVVGQATHPSGFIRTEFLRTTWGSVLVGHWAGSLLMVTSMPLFGHFQAIYWEP